MSKPTHSVMSHSLAKALMESGVQHFDIGGFIGDALGQNHYQAQLAPTQQSNYGGTIDQAQQQALSGYDKSQDVYSQQQALANALLAQSNGEGPNPAQAALNASTGQNVANQAALMASQRGAGANAGLLARQAAQQGAAIQQQAGGQGAVLQAQQQLAARQQLGAQQQAMQQGNLGQQAASTSLLGAASGAQNAQNNTSVANYGMQQGINAGIEQKNAEGKSKGIGGILGGIAGAAGSLLGFAEGGEIPAGRTHLPDHIHDVAKFYHPEYSSMPSNYLSGGQVPGQGDVQGNSIKNDVVPAMLSPKEIVLPRTVTMAPDAPQRAAAFVQHLMDREDAQKGYSKVAETKRKSS